VTETDVDSIRAEIYAHGPMEAGFSVYQDFFNYKSGVYVYTTGGYAGGHAIKILGWGYDEDSELDYWLCANSWGTSWGEKGFFKIAWGQCGIEQQVIACTPKV
jgi:cathepsin B